MDVWKCTVEAVGSMMDHNFFSGKKILITGHTGFKGAWMSQVLLQYGADLYGYALQPPTTPSLYQLLGIENKMHSINGDIRDLPHLEQRFREIQPEIVIHLAAQPLVRESYIHPVSTYETNVMGTVHICDCVRQNTCVKSFLNVTTDKVYLNQEWEWGYREDDRLDGYDPYSNSKSCSELVTNSYCKSFFQNSDVAVSTARAGNVIGGGDFAVDRILPDCMRAAQEKREIRIRNPFSIRPYQHVLEPVMAYLMIVKEQYFDKDYAGNYNVGPEDKDCISTGDLVKLFCSLWGEGQSYAYESDNGPHEANFLKLDCSRLKSRFGWKPKWSVEESIAKTVEWAKAYQNDSDLSACISKQIREYTETK